MTCMAWWSSRSQSLSDWLGTCKRFLLLSVWKGCLSLQCVRQHKLFLRRRLLPVTCRLYLYLSLVSKGQNSIVVYTNSKESSNSSSIAARSASLWLKCSLNVFSIPTIFYWTASTVVFAFIAESACATPASDVLQGWAYILVLEETAGIVTCEWCCWRNEPIGIEEQSVRERGTSPQSNPESSTSMLSRRGPYHSFGIVLMYWRLNSL